MASSTTTSTTTSSSRNRSHPEKDNLRNYSKLVKEELGLQGIERFEAIATKTIQIKESHRTNRCKRCWHDKLTRCICWHIPPLKEEQVTLPVKILVLMHYKEYLSAGNDAKLLLALLPNAKQQPRSQLYVFGKRGEWEKFQDECSIDPTHTIILWPAENALTIEGFRAQLPEESPWRNEPKQQREPLPILRVILLDGVYSQARSMFKTIKRRFRANNVPIPPYIALHPKTLSVYHRATKNYATSSAVTVQKSTNPKALHICSVEAFALLLQELGETESTTQTLVQAVTINNLALLHDVSVRPPKKKLQNK